MKLKINRTRGMKDIFGENAEYFLKIRDMAVSFSLENGFQYIETPVVENESLYTLSLGMTSDVVSKEMFHIKGKEKKESFVLRPEGTSSVVRAYFENGMTNLSQPVSLFYFQKMYRKERPQYGRLREHTQWGLEILNSQEPFTDFLIIYLFNEFFKKLNVEINFGINSLGCAKCRNKYRRALISYYNKNKKNLCLDCQRRLKENPLRLLDCKHVKDQEYKKNAPNILDFLCKGCEIHLQKVVEPLDYFKINYFLDKNIVRGFDYYEKTVFEGYVPGYNFAVVSGGRYDLGNVIANISLPSFGGSLGIERLKIIFDNKNISFKYYPQPQIFVAFAGEEIRNKALEIYDNLRKNKFRVTANFLKTSLSSQLDYANKIGVKYSLILGFQEIGKDLIIFKNMSYGNQEILKIKNLPEQLRALIKEKNE